MILLLANREPVWYSFISIKIFFFECKNVVELIIYETEIMLGYNLYQKIGMNCVGNLKLIGRSSLYLFVFF